MNEEIEFQKFTFGYCDIIVEKSEKFTLNDFFSIQIIF